MAEIIKAVNNNRNRISKSKKFSTRIDLTPMVDLGFLLITFFIFTTNMRTPMVMKLALPNTNPTLHTLETTAAKTLTLLLASDDKIYWYTGEDIAMTQRTDYSAKGLRSIIQNKKKMLKNKYGSDDDLFVIIKPTDASNYKNITDALDEMLINKVERYMLLDVDKNEIKYTDLK